MVVCVTRDQGRARIAALVAAFKLQEADHLAALYNETQARTDFISPMLEAFGWDVYNALGQPLGLREVFEEATVEVGEERLCPSEEHGPMQYDRLTRRRVGRQLTD